MAENQNVYFQARKSAAKYNDKLSSREGASEMLGMSPSTLADYELGNIKVVPVDKVVLMSDLYNAPELKNLYCKNECPIGRGYSIATAQRGIEGIALRLMREFEPERVDAIRKELIDIAEDGVISDDEKPRLQGILDYLDKMSEVISELKLAGEKAMGGEQWK